MRNGEVIPEPSQVRVYARKMGYITAILTAVITFIGIQSPFVSNTGFIATTGWIYPLVVGFTVYTVIRGATPLPTTGIKRVLTPSRK